MHKGASRTSIDYDREILHLSIYSYRNSGCRKFQLVDPVHISNRVYNLEVTALAFKGINLQECRAVRDREPSGLVAREIYFEGNPKWLNVEPHLNLGQLCQLSYVK